MTKGKKARETGKRIRSGKWFFPVVMNIVVMMALTLLFYAKYNCEMDIFMQTLLYGTSSSGECMSHLVFINVVVGGILDVLVKCMPGVAWYTIMHYAATLAALISISYFFINRYQKSKLSMILATVLSLFVGYECYITPMYMKTTVLVSVVSVLWLLHAMTESRKGIGSCVWGVIFGAFGSLLSFPIFVATIAISLAGAFLYLLLTKFERKRLMLPLLSLGIMLLLSVLFYWVDVRAYTTDGEWQAMGQQRRQLEQLYVMGHPTFADMEDVLIENGYVDLKKETYNQIMQGFYYNGVDYTGILQLTANERIEVSPVSVLEFFHTMPIKAFKTGMFYLWLIFAIVMAALRPNKKTAGILAISVVLFWIPYFAQYFSYGCNAQWMGMIAYLPSVFFLLWFMPPLELLSEENRYVVVYLSLTGLILYYIFSGAFIGKVQDAKEIGDAVALQHEETQCAHLMDMLSYFKNFSIYAPYPKQVDAANIYMVNGIYQWVPNYRNYHEMYQTDYEGYKIYTRSEAMRKCVVQNIKLDISLKGFEREDLDAFHGLHGHAILKEAYAEAIKEN